MNVVQMILDLLSGSGTTGKIASALGISQDRVGKAINAAVPAVLSGLLGVSTRPGGGGEIGHILQDMPSGLSDHLSNLSGGNADAIAAQGIRPLASLLGEGGLSQINAVLARFTGISEGITSKLLGVIAPVVLGVLGKQVKGFGAAEVSGFLASQQENIQSAMPSGLSNMLVSAVPALGSVLGPTAPYLSPDTAPAHGSSPIDRSDRTAEPAPTAREAGDWWKWAIPLILVALLLYFVPQMFRERREAPPAVGEEGAPGLTQERISAEGSNLLYQAIDQISSIKDEATAETALPQIRAITEKIGGLRALVADLPGPAQQGVLNTLRPVAERARKTATPILALPNIGPKVKPTIDEFFKQVDMLLGTPEITAPLVP